MNRISAYLGTVKQEQFLGGIVAKWYRNGAEVLVEWKHWKEEAWDPCPFGSLDKAKCSARLCPCAVLQVNQWVNGISGYLGTVKLVKYLASKNGNGRGNGHGSGPTRENRQTVKAG